MLEIYSLVLFQVWRHLGHKFSAVSFQLCLSVPWALNVEHVTLV